MAGMLVADGGRGFTRGLAARAERGRGSCHTAHSEGEGQLSHSTHSPYHATRHDKGDYRQQIRDSRAETAEQRQQSRYSRRECGYSSAGMPFARPHL